MVSWPAAALGPDLRAGVPYYGAAPATADLAKIEAALLIEYAWNDDRINSMWPGYEAAMKANGVANEMHMYSGTLHGFHNYLTPRYVKAAAELSWERTVTFFGKHIG